MYFPVDEFNRGFGRWMVLNVEHGDEQMMSIHMGVWHDRNKVPYISTMYGPETDYVQRNMLGNVVEDEDDPHPQGWARRTVAVPKCLAKYMDKMGAVDIFDQTKLARTGSLEMNMVTNKWWHKLFWGLLDMAITNAWIVKKLRMPKDDQKKYSRKKFMYKLAKELCENELGRGAVVLPPTPVAASAKKRKVQPGVDGTKLVFSPTTQHTYRYVQKTADPDNNLSFKKKYEFQRCFGCKIRCKLLGKSWKERQPSEIGTFCIDCKEGSGLWLCGVGGQTKYPECVGKNSCWSMWHSTWAQQIESGEIDYKNQLKKALKYGKEALEKELEVLASEKAILSARKKK